jgi:hypothetical protein
VLVQVLAERELADALDAWVGVLLVLAHQER